MAAPALILASTSLRRLDLLRQIGVEPRAICAADIDETPRKGELPRALAMRLAQEKAEAVVKQRAALPSAGDEVVLAADTVVAVGRRILPKAEREEEARACLALLSGRAHRVYTAVMIARADGLRRVRAVESRVIFKRLSNSETEHYLRSGEWRGKAGGYAIQGLAASYISFISGSYTGIVGLPLYETAHLLGSVGLVPQGPQ